MIVTLTIGFISGVLMILYFLATHDIFNDYIGSGIISRGIVNIVGEIPEWTACKSEWAILQVDYIVRFIFMILNMVVLIRLIIFYDIKKSAQN